MIIWVDSDLWRPIWIPKNVRCTQLEFAKRGSLDLSFLLFLNRPFNSSNTVL